MTSVYNATRGTLVARQVTWACTFWARARGLLGRRELPVGEGLAISPCKSVHMWGMRFPIDVLYLSRDGEVVACVEHLRPWRVGPIVRTAEWVLEVPAGTLGTTGTRKGDQLNIREEK